MEVGKVFWITLKGKQEMYLGTEGVLSSHSFCLKST